MGWAKRPGRCSIDCNKMALSKAGHLSTDNGSNGMPSAAAIIAAATLGFPLPPGKPDVQLTSEPNALVRATARKICSGCRCGWLCCDCHLGCVSCKERRRFCYCRWECAWPAAGLTRVFCEICVEMFKLCHCKRAFHCKWCTVSFEKCKRGGCVSRLPKRSDPNAAPYVAIFNREDQDNDEHDDDVDHLSLTASTCSQYTGTSSSLTSLTSTEFSDESDWMGENSDGDFLDVPSKESGVNSCNCNARVCKSAKILRY